MPELELDVAHWLVGPDGLDAVAAATQLLDAGTDELRALTVLRRQTGDPRRTAAALAAGTARRRARDRWPEADRLLFTREALEQASDPTVAAWRARRFEDAHVIDLCSGVGGDATALARTARSVLAIDLDEARLVLLRHNAAVLDVEISSRHQDALDVEVPRGALVHVDPARRREGRRIADPTQTLPPVDALVAAHGGGAGMAVVLAPGTDADHSALGRDVEVEYLQRGPDLVEAVAWSGRLRDGAATASATLLPRTGPPAPVPRAPAGDASGGSLGVVSGPDPIGGTRAIHRSRRGPRGARLPVAEIGDHLLQVAPAAVRARLHDEIGAEVRAHRVAEHRALLTLNGPVPSSPWYRARSVVTVLPARTAALRRWFAATAREPVELVLHGVEIDPTVWWREVGRPTRGPDGIRVELIRRDEDRIAVITRTEPTEASGAG